MVQVITGSTAISLTILIALLGILVTLGIWMFKFFFMARAALTKAEAAQTYLTKKDFESRHKEVVDAVEKMGTGFNAKMDRMIDLLVRHCDHRGE
jgi:hypothetical protein